MLLTQVMSHNEFKEECWGNLFASSNGRRKEFEDKYPLNMTWLHQDQCNNVQLSQTVEEILKKNEFKYTYKEAEGKN